MVWVLLLVLVLLARIGILLLVSDFGALVIWWFCECFGLRLLLCCVDLLCCNVLI